MKPNYFKFHSHLSYQHSLPVLLRCNFNHIITAAEKLLPGIPIGFILTAINQVIPITMLYLAEFDFSSNLIYNIIVR